MTRPTLRVSRAMASTCFASASNMSFDSAFNFSARFSVSVATPPLFSRRTRSLIARLLGTVPPSAAERLKQAGRIGKTIGFGLDQCQLRLLIRLFRVQHRDQRDRSHFPLVLREIESPLRGAFGVGAGAQCIAVRLQRAQGIGHILARKNDG